MKVRYETFGAIVSLDEVPALAWVDRDMVESLGYPPSPLWQQDRPWLEAPVEVHLMTTERCPAGCPGCYVDATPTSAESPTDVVRDALRKLADAGVFHVAMGGGEALLRDDLFELAAFARSVGLVPNLTTSGIGMTAERAEACRVFGQVNVSLDGLGETYRRSRGYDGAERALRALELLVAAGVPSGINFVVSRVTLDALESTAERIAAIGANEIELLRYKPTGRARKDYLARRLDEDQARGLPARMMAIAMRHPHLQVKLDCSMVPLLCAAGPDPEWLERFGVIGCEAGNVLAAVRADMTATACSFIEEPLGDVSALVDRWHTHPELRRWREFPDTAPEPCRSCPYARVCRGGCKAVSLFHHGEAFHPDPECPRVLAWRRGELHTPA